MKTILLIDDDERLAEPLKIFLGQYDFQLISQTHPIEALDFLYNNPVALIILDIMLPEIDGFETCRRIRQFLDTPIIMLTARGDVMDRVVGLELGADDYMPKPFEPRELVARIQNVLKRLNPVRTNREVLQFKGLVIDQQIQQVTLDNRVLELTSAEYRLLALLANEPHKIFSRDVIMNEMSGIDADLYSRAVDILVSRLRQKLKPLDAIKTIRSRGYQFTMARAD